MTDKQKSGVEKFLERHMGDLIKHDYHKNNSYVILSKTEGGTKYFLYEEKHNLAYVNSKVVIDPILKIFQTDYNETYDFVNEWLKKKYGIVGDDLIGV